MINTYIPSEVKVNVGGFICVGVENISVEWPDKPFTMLPALYGKHVRIRNKHNSAIVTITVMQTSITNDVLSDIHRNDKFTGSGRFVFNLTDLSGNTKISSNNAFISSYPSTAFGRETGSRTWEICLLNVDKGSEHVGSNFKPAINLFG